MTQEQLDSAGNGWDTAFNAGASSVTFGPGCLGEAGDVARSLGMTRVALLTDPRLAATGHFRAVKDSLTAAGLVVAAYEDARVEPTDKSFTAAAEFATAERVDGFVSLGGGSVIDTAKAANLYSTHPADFLTYVGAPIGDGAQVPGSLLPHIACPTTSGTGSECTGIAVFDLLEIKTKTSIISKRIRPTHALVDPDCTRTLPAMVVACTAFDVLSHALESYTARPYCRRPAPARPSLRPSSQGANPWSDLGCREALRILGRYLLRGVADTFDVKARHQLMWAATLAGIAFGNSGCHAPHAMSYSASGLVRDFRAEGYPSSEPMVPHGMSVVLNAPSLFRRSAVTDPARHRLGAELLGADLTDVADGDVGEALADQIIALMQATGMPNGLSGIGYTSADVPELVAGGILQSRLLSNAPITIDGELLTALYSDALSYW